MLYLLRTILKLYWVVRAGNCEGRRTILRAGHFLTSCLKPGFLGLVPGTAHLKPVMELA